MLVRSESRTHDLPRHSPVHNQVSHRCAVFCQNKGGLGPPGPSPRSATGNEICSIAHCLPVFHPSSSSTRRSRKYITCLIPKFGSTQIGIRFGICIVRRLNRALVSHFPTYASKLLAETCVQRHHEQVSQSGVTQWNSRFRHHCDRCGRCESRKRYYFWWNLSRNGSSKRFTKPTMLQGATPPDTCFATPLHRSFI